MRFSDLMSSCICAGASMTMHVSSWLMMYPLVRTYPPVYEIIGMEFF